MNSDDMVNISERYMELINPSTTEKMLAVGKSLRVQAGACVIDFGCGFGEELGAVGRAFGLRLSCCKLPSRKVLTLKPSCAPVTTIGTAMNRITGMAWSAGSKKIPPILTASRSSTLFTSRKTSTCSTGGNIWAGPCMC